MPYSTTDELAERLTPEVLALLADADADGTPDAATLEAALADASALIDLALAGRYTTPVDPAPPTLAVWCADLASETLFLRRPEALPEAQAHRAARAHRALEAITTGAAALPGAQPRLEDFETDNTRREDEPAFSPESLDVY